MIRAAYSSVADTAIVPMQDILGLGKDARMNTPATSSGNWAWRLADDALNDGIAATLFEMTETYGRTNPFAKPIRPS
jgi:4-alpha-glucanotransferase